MKIAILLFGHLRNFETCADSLSQHVLSKYDCDVFMHTWDERDAKTKSWHTQICESVALDEATIDLVKQKYNPTKILIEHQEKYADEQIIPSAFIKDYNYSTAPIHFMFYSMNKANELRKNYEKDFNVAYDYVLVTRPDICFYSDFDIQRVIKQCTCFGLNIPKCRFFAAYPVSSHSSTATLLDAASDVLFFGTPTCIDTYVNENKNLDIDYIRSHNYGTTSTYLCREIEAGLMPIPIGYLNGIDWNFSAPRVDSSSPIKKPKSNLKQFVKKSVRFMLFPFSWLFKKYPGLM